jgi:hypothetical protein
MRKAKPTKKRKENYDTLLPPDFTSPETNTDKTGVDNDADKTVKRNVLQKSKIENDPDSTGIDTKADKTKKETFPDQQKKK